LGLYSHGEESTMTLRQCHSGRHKKLRITFLKNVCSDPSFAREINYTVRDGKCHWSLSKWPISQRREVTSLHMKSSQPSLANSACTTRVKYPTKSGRALVHPFLILARGYGQHHAELSIHTLSVKILNSGGITDVNAALVWIRKDF